MKTLTVVLVVTVLVIHISGYLIKVPTLPEIQPKGKAPAQWLHVQKLMLPLFENVCEASINPVIRRLSQEFTFNSEDYSEPEVISNLQKCIAAGLLPKGEIFSEYNPEHMKELKIIYEVLYSAKDFDAFYKAAAWARQNLNCGLYVNAIYMSIQSRRDIERISIPAPYELLPNYFVLKDVIVQASSILAGQEVSLSEGVRDEGNAYYLDANYTAMFHDNDDDSKLAYFREDIGLNSYYFLRKLRLSPWLNDDLNGRYGENMYQMMKQFMARYNLERYANGFSEIDGIDWNALPDVPYDPKLIYSDGSEFVHRTSHLKLPINDDITLLQTIENNIVEVVDHMRQSGYNKTQILNHLMEILVTGDRSYETLSRQLLGKNCSDNGHVSVLEHYKTSLRDPMFWRINKKIVDLVDSALKTLPSYTRNELYFPGVEVVNIDVKKMMTAYDYFEFDVTDALKIEDSNSTFNVKIGQPRLNHKPFTIKVNISSLVTKKGLMKIYLGPKMMPGELASKKNLFTLLDLFEVNLKIGSNIISRSSDDMRHFSADFMSLKTIRKIVENVEFGIESLPPKMIESQIGYPSRLILPRGSPQGLLIQMFVFVAPFIKASVSDSYSANSMEFNSAILSPGYPLDLMIEDRQLFALPNALIKYVTVTQKGDSKVENYGGPGITKSWYSSKTYDPSTRPSYSPGNREPFDYNAKRGSYGNKEDFSAKVNEYNVAEHEHFDFEKENQGDIITAIPHLLKSSKSDFSSKAKINEENIKKAKSNNKDNFGTVDDYSNYQSMLPLTNDFDFSKKNKSSTNLNKHRLLNALHYEKEPFVSEKKKAEFVNKNNSDKKEENIEYQNAKLKEEVAIIPRNINPVNDNAISDIENKYKVDTMPRLLKLSKFDYSSKSQNREPFDNTAKISQFDKKDYSAKRGDYNKYQTVKPVEEETIVSTMVTPISEVDLSRLENLENTISVKPRILKSAKYDYSSKYQDREKFDYKAKKAEFDKKDYSAKREDSDKYQTVKVAEEETIVSTMATPINEVDLSSLENLENTISVTPRILKSAKYDFSSKHRDQEKNDYKAKKPEFEKKNYSAKGGYNTKDRAVVPEEVGTMSTIATESNEDFVSDLENQDNPNNTNFDYSSKFKAKEKFDYKAKKAEFDKSFSTKRRDYVRFNTSSSEEEGVMTTVATMTNEDFVSDLETRDNINFDDSSKYKVKEKFDYKSKKAQFDKKYFSAKRGDYTQYRTVKPNDAYQASEEPVSSIISTPEYENAPDKLARVPLYKDVNNLIKENKVLQKEHIHDDEDTREDHLIDFESIFPLNFVKKHTPSVYDFLFHTFDYEDSPEVKVYE